MAQALIPSCTTINLRVIEHKLTAECISYKKIHIRGARKVAICKISVSLDPRCNLSILISDLSSHCGVRLESESCDVCTFLCDFPSNIFHQSICNKFCIGVQHSFCVFFGCKFLATFWTCLLLSLCFWLW